MTYNLKRCLKKVLAMLLILCMMVPFIPELTLKVNAATYIDTYSDIPVIYPTGIAVDSKDNLYVCAETELQKYDSNHNLVWKQSAFGGDIFVRDVAIDSNDNIYVSAMQNKRVYKINTNGIIEPFISNVEASAIATDSSGNIFTTEINQNKVSKYDRNGFLDTSWGIGGSITVPFPKGIAINSSDEIYVSSQIDYKVYKYNSNGTSAIGWIDAVGADTATYAMYYPNDLNLDSNGDLYIADYSSYCVFKLSGTDGHYLKHWGVLNTPGITAGLFQAPQDVAVDSKGNVYVSDFGVNKVVFIQQVLAPTPATDFTYSDNADGTTVSITGYTGTDTDIIIPSTNPDGKSITKIGNRAFYYKTTLTKVVLPDTITEIGNEAFFCCSSLASVTLGNQLQYIGKLAFNSTIFTTIDLPNSLITIDEQAFRCTKITELTVPSCTSIASKAFESSDIARISLPANITSISEDAFWNCSNLNEINVDELNTIYSDINGILYNASKTELIIYPGGKIDTEFTVPDNVQTIAKNAFGSATNLNKLIFPASLTSIGDGAFYNLWDLKAYFHGTAPTLGINSFDGSITTVYCKPENKSTFALVDGKWNDCTLLEWSEAATGMTASVTAKSTPESGKVMLTVTPGASDESHKVYYRAVSSDPTAMNVGDTITTSAWTEVTGTTAQEISVVNGSYIEVVEITSADSKVTKWGKSAVTADGYVAPVAATGMGTSVGPKLIPEDGKIMLGVAPEASDANHKIYYRVVSSDPSGMYKGEIIDTDEWKEVIGIAPKEISAVDGSYIEVVEITIADSKVTKWGKSAATNDWYTVPVPGSASGITVSVVPKAIPENNKVVLAATSSAIVPNSQLFYIVTATQPVARNVGDTINTGEWMIVTDSNAMEISAINGSYIEVVEVTTVDNKITQWGKSGVITDGCTLPTVPIIPAVPTNPVQDDTNNTFGWTYVPGYSLITDYEYSLNNGSTWTNATTNPIVLSDQDYPAGAIVVRVKEDAASGRVAGGPLVSTIAYTRAVSTNPGGGSSNPGGGTNTGSNNNTINNPNTSGTVRQVVVQVGDVGNDSLATQIDIVRTVENNKKVDSVNLDNSKMEEVLKKAVDQKKDNVIIIIDEPANDKADEVSINVTGPSIKKLADNKTSIKVKTEAVTIELPKETVQALSEREEDLYFRVVPVRDESDKQEVIKNTIQASIVKEIAGNDKVEVYGTPMTIETNYQNQTTKVTFSLKDIPIPTDAAARKEFLDTLAVYIQHSDGEKVLERGTIKYDSQGNPLGIEIVLTKFSTFTIIGVNNVAPVVQNVLVKGSTIIGRKLTVSYKYSDFDKDLQGKSTIKWYRADSAKGRNKKVIAGANKLSYNITDKDKGKYIIFEITPKAKSGVVKGKTVAVSTKAVIRKAAVKAVKKEKTEKNK